MRENNVKETILDEMEEADIIYRDGHTLGRKQDGREYLIMVTVIDITDWDSHRGLEE